MGKCYKAVSMQGLGTRILQINLTRIFQRLKICGRKDLVLLSRHENISLLTDFDALDTQEIIKKRDELVKKSAKIYESAPQTDSKSYAEAQDALKNKEEQFFTQQELNVMLPIHLRKDI